MKYYAVTEDPNELIHWGRRGMKWGKHIFGKDRERSQAFKNAAKKLKSGIAEKKTQWREASIQRSKDRTKMWNQKMREQDKKLDYKLGKYKYNLAMRQLRRETRAEDKARRQEAKSEKLFNKRVQEAREGNLRYGKLTDEQVLRLTNRLAMEQRARALGNTERPKHRLAKRIKEAAEEGMLQGAARGGAAYIEETWRAKGKAHGEYVANKAYGKKIAKQRARQNKILDEQRRESRRKDIDEDIKNEGYRADVMSAQSSSIFAHPFSSVRRSAGAINKAQRERDRLALKRANDNIEIEAAREVAKENAREQARMGLIGTREQKKLAESVNKAREKAFQDEVKYQFAMDKYYRDLDDYEGEQNRVTTAPTMPELPTYRVHRLMSGVTLPQPKRKDKNGGKKGGNKS